MTLFDTHAHLDEDVFQDDRQAVVQRASQAGVTSIISVATTLASSRRCLEIAGSFDHVFPSVGIQPNYCAEAGENDWDQIVELARSPQVVALGETGLDRHWDYTPFAMQQDYFDRHIRLSQDLQIPFIVHMRECGADIVTMLRDARQRGPLQGVMHSFTGDASLAEECLELGLYISFAGMVTFKKSDELRSVAAGITSDRLLLETDAPYLSPHPHRGQRPNEPALMIHTAACLAETRGISLEVLAQQTTANAHQLFSRVSLPG
ncbi:MAG: TatD family hydrolase [Pirellulaceae bacterium]|jgi:TatD DNase family protein|nr:TatD family hydrolase [Pirellulaceae bacterium]